MEARKDSAPLLQHLAPAHQLRGGDVLDDVVAPWPDLVEAVREEADVGAEVVQAVFHDEIEGLPAQLRVIVPHACDLQGLRLIAVEGADPRGLLEEDGAVDVCAEDGCVREVLAPAPQRGPRHAVHAHVRWKMRIVGPQAQLEDLQGFSPPVLEEMVIVLGVVVLAGSHEGVPLVAALTTHDLAQGGRRGPERGREGLDPWEEALDLLRRRHVLPATSASSRRSERGAGAHEDGRSSCSSIFPYAPSAVLAAGTRF